MTRPVAVLDPRTDVRPAHAHPSLEGEIRPLDVARLPDLDLEPYPAVLVAGMVDQELLRRQRDVIAGVLERGGTVVFCGHLHRRWLPGCRRFVPAGISSFRHYAVELPDEPHPVFAGVDAEDLTFRRGVAGFFARGHHPPPPGAEILARLHGGQPTTWVDTTTTPGRILVHAGINLLRYAWEESSATRVPGQLLAWLREGSAR